MGGGFGSAVRCRAQMPEAAALVQRTYLILTLLTTFASSFVWGINTIFLLDAG